MRAASGALNNQVEQLTNLATFVVPPAPNTDRRKAAAGIVTKAAGLTKAFNRLDALLSTVQAQGERRPHHQVAIKSTSDDEKTAQLTPLESLMPDDVKGDGGPAESSAPPSAR